MELVRIVESKNKMHEKPGHQNGREGKAEGGYRFGALRFAQARELRPDSNHRRSQARVAEYGSRSGSPLPG